MCASGRSSRRHIIISHCRDRTVEKSPHKCWTGDEKDSVRLEPPTVEDMKEQGPAAVTAQGPVLDLQSSSQGLRKDTSLETAIGEGLPRRML